MTRRPETSPSLTQQARDLYADALAKRGPAYRNASDSIRAGTYGNMWTEAALAAIEQALRQGPDHVD